MKKDYLKTIKDDITEVYRSNREYFRQEVKEALAEIEADHKEAMSRHAAVWGDSPDYLAAEIYAERKRETYFRLVDDYSNGQFYYFIYKDGSAVTVTAEDLLTGGAKLPKLTNIAYALMEDADSWIDTEIGDLDAYFDGVAPDEDLPDRLERLADYENSIEARFGTEYGLKLTAAQAA